jgi:hypothetical protein
MDFATVIEQARAAWERTEAMIIASPELAGVGLALGIGAIVSLIALALTGLVRIGMAVRRAMLAAAVKRNSDVGARILVVRGFLSRQRSVASFLRKAVDAHLKDYMFGGPFKVINYPGGLEGDERAAKLLKRTEADLVLWAEVSDGGRLLARILSRPSNTFEQARPAIELAMPKERSAWNATLLRAMAYAAAKQFRPALGRRAPAPRRSPPGSRRSSPDSSPSNA